MKEIIFKKEGVEILKSDLDTHIEIVELKDGEIQRSYVLTFGGIIELCKAQEPLLTFFSDELEPLI